MSSKSIHILSAFFQETKKNFFSFILLFLALSFLAILFLFFPRQFFFKPLTKNEKPITLALINNQPFQVEIADDEQERARGLSWRADLCSDCGMLFIFPEKNTHAFWMKDMFFPLDIIWIEDSRVVFIAEEISPDFKGIINPPKPADKVLEINASLCRRYGIQVGDIVIFK